MSETSEETIRAALRDMGLAGTSDDLPMTPLEGGVSCDVFVVDLGMRRICVKRALPKLRVAADWRAPAARAETEVAWFRLVGDIDPALAPAVLAGDRARHLFAMEYLPPERYPLWKAQLAGGAVDPDFAAQVGSALARIHARTAGDDAVADLFSQRAQFHALRIEPYLLHTAARNPDVAGPIREMAAAVASSRIAVMHGDVSPKNILRGPHGPVFLDAETACIGDPAFDLAFCLNHLLLKGAWHPDDAEALASAFTALQRGYFAGLAWEREAGFEHRASRLLSALLLARIDGKSPVEYLTDAPTREFVRARAKSFLANPDWGLDEVLDRWTRALLARD